MTMYAQGTTIGYKHSDRLHVELTRGNKCLSFNKSGKPCFKRHTQDTVHNRLHTYMSCSIYRVHTYVHCRTDRSCIYVFFWLVHINVQVQIDYMEVVQVGYRSMVHVGIGLQWYISQ
jgi:hypothetical protein